MGEHQLYLSKAMDFLAAGMLSTFGGVSAYLYSTYKNGQKFSLPAFAINVALAFFLGNVIGSFLPESFQYRDGILMIAGFSTFPLLGVMEVYVKKFAVKYLDDKFGLGEDKKDA